MSSNKIIESFLAGKATRPDLEKAAFLLDAFNDIAKRTSDTFNTFGNIAAFASLGLVPGVEVKRVSGFRANVSTAIIEVIATQGGKYPYPLSEQTLNISSTSLNDTLAGTGAQVIKIEGLAQDHSEISETKNLDGTNIVQTTQLFFRVNAVTIIQSGSLGANDGVISITQTTSGFLLAEVIKSATNEGVNKLFSTVQTIPVGKIALLTGVLASITRTFGGSGIKEANILFQVSAPGPSQHFIPFSPTGLRSDGSGVVQVPVDYPFVIDEKFDMEFAVTSLSNNTTVSTAYTYLLIDKATYGL